MDTTCLTLAILACASAGILSAQVIWQLMPSQNR